MKAQLRLHGLAHALLGIGLATSASLGTARDHHEPNDHRSAATWCAERCDEVVTDWSLTALQVITAADGYADPMAASRSPHCRWG